MRDIGVHKQIGDRLRVGRQQMNLTLKEAATPLGVSVAHLSAVELGRAQATVGTLLGACELYGVSSYWVLYGKERWSSCPAEGRVDCRIRAAVMPQS
jgi:transcriptional regulator with XRE-family HTH domain